MNSIEELLEKLSLHDFDTGSSYWVDVTHINNPHSFYVRPTACRRFMAVVQTFRDPIDCSELQIRSTIVFYSEILQEYVRGQIVFIDNKKKAIKCDIFASDYGFLEKCVPLCKIFRAYHAIDVPPLATHCQLADCKPIGEMWTQKTIDAMKCFVGKERAKMIVREKSPDTLVVELRNTCPDDISTLLALTGYTLLGYGENEISRLTVPPTEKHYFTYQKFNVDDVFHVRLQSGDSLKSFYVAQINNYKQFLNERNNFTYFSQKQKNLSLEDIREGDPVAVYIDKYCKYERAIIQKISKPDQKVLVKLVDWGREEQVDISKLKKMSEKFFVHPVIAIYCSAEECQIWDNKLNKFLYPGYEFLITIKEIGEEFNSPNIVNLSPLNVK